MRDSMAFEHPMEQEEAAFEILDDGIVVLPEDGKLLHLDMIGGVVWLGCDEGEDPETIIRGLQQQFPDEADRVEHEILDSIGGWCHLGLLRDAGLPLAPVPAQEKETGFEEGLTPLPRIAWNREIVGRYLDLGFAVRVSDSEVEAVLRSILQTLADPGLTTLDLVFEVDRDSDDFVLSEGAFEVIRSDDSGEIAAEVMRRIRAEAIRKRGGVAVISGVVASAESGHTLFIGFPAGWRPEKVASEASARGEWLLHENGFVESIAGWQTSGKMLDIDTLVFAGEEDEEFESQLGILRRLLTEGFTEDTRLDARGLRVVIEWLFRRESSTVRDEQG